MPTKQYIFTTLFLLVHKLCTLCEVVLNMIVYIWNKCVNYYDFWIIRNNVEYVLRNVRYISKLPTHLTIFLGEEPLRYRDLANLVVWSIASNIGFISFYDYKGILNESQDKLKKIIEEIKNPGDHIIWHNGELSYINGFKGKKIYVKILPLSVGRQAIVEATKQLTVEKDIEISGTTVDSYLKRSFVFPDPDLGLYCGRTFNLCGYPPWQVRVTEFLSLHSYYEVSPRTFIKMLFKYNKTEQRLGK